MLQPNQHYAALAESYLFARIAQRVKEYGNAHPDARLLRMGIGDVSRPLCPAVIRALHEAVEDQGILERFDGYMPECGAPELREAIVSNKALRCGEEVGDILFSAVYLARTLDLEPEECLTASSEKFIRRFCAAEEIAREEGKNIPELHGEELSALWQKAKEQTTKKRG